MHYSVFLALVISVITTFLLGILITEMMFNTSLGYFGASMNSIDCIFKREEW